MIFLVIDVEKYNHTLLNFIPYLTFSNRIKFILKFSEFYKTLIM